MGNHGNAQWEVGRHLGEPGATVDENHNASTRRGRRRTVGLATCVTRRAASGRIQPIDIRPRRRVEGEKKGGPRDGMAKDGVKTASRAAPQFPENGCFAASAPREGLRWQKE